MLPTLVVVDDQPELCDLVLAVAKADGYDATAAIDPIEWLLRTEAAPDVIILDLMMPGMDGIEVLRKLAERGQKSRIILSSAHSERVLDSSMRLAKALGLNIVGRLPKPVKPAQLRDLLRQQMALARPATAGAPQPTLDELQEAIRENQFVIHFQPQVAFSDGHFVGVEALMRWQHPRHGLLAPGTFVGLAESSGLALPLTRCAMERGLPDCGFLHQHGLDGTVSFNLPPAALNDVRFPEEMTALVERYQTDGMKILFEITETSLASDVTMLLDILTRLRLKGFALSIDDFGTGHSSLSMLHQMPFTELKVDLNFVLVAEADTTAHVIVEKSVALGRELGLKVVAEGVENQLTWNWLKDIGCDVAQGYHIARPMPAAELPAWWKTWHTRSIAAGFTDR